MAFAVVEWLPFPPAEKARSLWPGVRQRWQIAEEEAAIAFFLFFSSIIILFYFFFVENWNSCCCPCWLVVGGESGWRSHTRSTHDRMPR